MANKAFFMAIVLMLAAAAANAQVGSIDTECTDYGFDYGIVKYEWYSGDGDPMGYYPEDPAISPYVITVSGTVYHAEWTADPAVAGVLHKEGSEQSSGGTYIHPGGTSGTIDNFNLGISHITFCGNYDTSTTTPQAPEVGSVGVLAAILLSAPAFAYLLVRKRK